MIEILHSHFVHEGGTKFYQITTVYITGSSNAPACMVTRWGKVGARGTVKQDELDPGIKTHNHRKECKKRMKRGYNLVDSTTETHISDTLSSSDAMQLANRVTEYDICYRSTILNKILATHSNLLKTEPTPASVDKKNNYESNNSWGAW